MFESKQFEELKGLDANRPRLKGCRGRKFGVGDAVLNHAQNACHCVAWVVLSL